MNKNKQRQIKVHVHWEGLSSPMLVGILNATQSRSKEIFSFQYDNL